MLECVMLQLRLSDGVQLRRFSDTFGRIKAEQLLCGVQPHVTARRAFLRRDDGTRVSTAEVLRAGDLDVSLCLTDPRGLIVSNDIISDLFLALEAV